MSEIFSLLTIVSNNSVPNWAHIAIQISMWVAVVSQIFLLVPDMIFVIRTKDTRENKWFKWIVWFLCSAGWICYAIFLTWENIPIEEVVGLVVSEGVNLICLFIIYSVKIRNIVIAKRIGLTERQWCSLQHSFYLIKKAMSKPIRKSLRKAYRHLTPTERLKLYISVIRTHRVAHQLKRTVQRAAKKVARQMIKKANKKRA
ncbi:MAG: hypothetical protein ACOQNV_02610 [Mycoplasmoidaceae bacterium]